jgi:putative IMPACT (imprinted ancient) family translation regulator
VLLARLFVPHAKRRVEVKKGISGKNILIPPEKDRPCEAWVVVTRYFVKWVMLTRQVSWNAFGARIPDRNANYRLQSFPAKANSLL